MSKSYLKEVSKKKPPSWKGSNFSKENQKHAPPLAPNITPHILFSKSGLHNFIKWLYRKATTILRLPNPIILHFIPPFITTMTSPALLPFWVDEEKSQGYLYLSDIPSTQGSFQKLIVLPFPILRNTRHNILPPIGCHTNQSSKRLNPHTYYTHVLFVGTGVTRNRWGIQLSLHNGLVTNFWEHRRIVQGGWNKVLISC